MALSNKTLVSSIESEILRMQDGLRATDDNIKRLTGRDFGDPARIERRVSRTSFNGRDDEPPPKRKPSAGVFARLAPTMFKTEKFEKSSKFRLGAPVLEAAQSEGRPRKIKLQEVSNDEELILQKPAISSSVARPVGDGKSRTEAAAELTKDRASRDRNRRMFGALLGTLQRFRNDEAKQKDKEDKRVAIEKKLEEKGKAEIEEMRRERQNLFRKREEQKARIRRLRFKMTRVKEHEEWEAHQRKLKKFIRTKALPKIFWVPKVSNFQSSKLANATKDAIEDELEIARQKLKEELEEMLQGSVDDLDQEDVDDLEENGDEEVEEGELIQGNKDRQRRGFSPSPPPRAVPKHSPPPIRQVVHRPKLDFNNSDLLDYEAEEGELVYEDDTQVLPGKPKPERVIVQVNREIGAGREFGSHRKVELVSVISKVVESKRADDWKNSVQTIKDSSSEKENMNKSESVKEKEKHKSEKSHKDKKEKKDKKHKKKDKEKAKVKQNQTGELDGKTKEKEVGKTVLDIDLAEILQKRIKKEKGIEDRAQTNHIDLTENPKRPKAAISPNADETENKGAEPEEEWSEDLSHIMLPLDNIPILNANEDSQNSDIISKQKTVKEENVKEKKAKETNEDSDDAGSSYTPPLPPLADDYELQQPSKPEPEPDSDSAASSRYTPPPRSKTPEEDVVKEVENQRKVEIIVDKRSKGEDRHSKKSYEEDSESSSNTEDSSSDSGSSLSDSSSASSQNSETGSSSTSSLSSSSESERESKKKVQTKRRRPRRSSSESSTDSSSDSDGGRERGKKPVRPPLKRVKGSPPQKKARRGEKSDSGSDDQKRKKMKQKAGKEKESKREKERKEKEREDARKKEEREAAKKKEREREKERENARMREKEREEVERNRSRAKTERTGRRSRSRDKRRDRSRSREKRKDRK